MFSYRYQIWNLEPKIIVFLYQEGISPSASAVNIVNVKYFIVILTYINKIL